MASKIAGEYIRELILGVNNTMIGHDRKQIELGSKVMVNHV